MMEFIRGLGNIKSVDGAACAVTIGNFDGLHRGHQALIARTLDAASQFEAIPTAVIFEPHPREYFCPDDAPQRVFSLREKLDALATVGIQRVLCLRFDQRLAELAAAEFIRQILVDGLRARAVIVGEDFRFGADRAGDVKLLCEQGGEHGFEVCGLTAVAVGAERASSTRLRAALAAPDLTAVRALLGRRYAMHGRVRSGLRLGRELGMPTANILRHKPTALRHGVYAVRACWANRGPVAGVASLGVRPTLNLQTCLLETHLFEPPGDLYGQILEVEFVHFLRPQLRFDDLDALRRQMHEDAAQARALLGA